MSSQPRPLFDSSVAALVLVNARNGAAQPPTARTPSRVPRLTGGRATALPIQFAPEPDPTTNVVDLGEEQSTGPLPLGFEFEFFGLRYTWFDLSSDGFMTFGSDWSTGGSKLHLRGRFIPLNADLDNFIGLGWTNECPFARSKVAYEVRGAPGRFRLVLSFAGVLAADERRGAMIAQLVLHQRTGIIDVHTARRDPVSYQVTQEAVRFTIAPVTA